MRAVSRVLLAIQVGGCLMLSGPAQAADNGRVGENLWPSRLRFVYPDADQPGTCKAILRGAVTHYRESWIEFLGDGGSARADGPEPRDGDGVRTLRANADPNSGRLAYGLHNGEFAALVSGLAPYRQYSFQVVDIDPWTGQTRRSKVRTFNTGNCRV